MAVSKRSRAFRLGPLYTPQMLGGTVMRPSVGGGANWSGAAVDPETGYLYVPSANRHSTIRLTAPEPGEPATIRYVRRSLSAGPVMPQRAAAVEAAVHPHDGDRHEHR